MPETAGGVIAQPRAALRWLIAASALPRSARDRQSYSAPSATRATASLRLSFRIDPPSAARVRPNRNSANRMACAARRGSGACTRLLRAVLVPCLGLCTHHTYRTGAVLWRALRRLAQRALDIGAQPAVDASPVDSERGKWNAFLCEPSRAEPRCTAAQRAAGSPCAEQRGADRTRRSL